MVYGTKSQNLLLGGLTLPHIFALTRTLPKLQFPLDTLIQLTKPLDVATNIFTFPISEKDIGFPNTPYQCMFVVTNRNLNCTGIYSNGEHEIWYGSELVSKK